MSQSVLGSMIIELIGQDQKFSESIDRSEKKLNNFGIAAEKIGGNLTKWITLPIIGLGVAGVKAFGDSESALAELKASLIATNKVSEISVDKIAALAKELQGLTTYEDDSIVSMSAMIQTLSNLNEQQLLEIIPRVVDFAAAMKMDLNGAAQLVGKTLGSTTNALGRYGIQLEDNLSPSEKFVALTEAMDGKFKNFAQTIAGEGLGPLKQLQNELGDLAEEIGKQILPTINSLLPPIKDVIKAFGSLDDNTKKMIVTAGLVAATVGPVVGAVGGIAKGIGGIASIVPKVIGGVQSLNTAFMGTLGPISFIAGGIALSIGKWGSEIEKAKKELLDLQKSIDEKFLTPQDTDENLVKKSGKPYLDEIEKLEEKRKLAVQAISEIETRLALNKISNNKFLIEADEKMLKIQKERLASIEKEIRTINSNASKNGNLKTEIQDTKTFTPLQEYLIDRRQTELDIISKTVDAKGMLLNVNDIMVKQTGDILEEVEKETKAFEDLKAEYLQYTNLVANSLGPVFEAFGTALAGTTDGWKAFARAGLDSIAAIVDGLANMGLVEAAKEAAAAFASYPDVVGMGIHGTAAVQYGAAAALGKATAGLIRAIPIPMAEGGYIPYRPGGTLVQAAEAGNGEWYLPDRNDVVSRLANRLQTALPQPTGNINNVTNNNMPSKLTLNINGKDFDGYITDRSRRGSIIIDPKRGISKR